jgi:diketogulonate reductase-like aldo/keto reductase
MRNDQPYVEPPVQVTAFPNGAIVPVLGQGTWQMAQGGRPLRDEADALRLGIELGMSLIDTAEMYGDGAAESLVGEVIAGQRDEVFLVSKVLPHHADRRGTIAACEASLKRLRTDRIDLYLLHWPGRVPVGETVEAFRILCSQGKIGAWGVSNFDIDDMRALDGGPDGVQTDQVLYNLSRRGIEFDLLPWCRERSVPVMAYSPLEQGRLVGSRAFSAVATRHGASAAQVALAWVLAQPGVIAIPKSGSVAHVRENHAALRIRLSDADLADLNAAFPAPKRRKALEVL